MLSIESLAVLAAAIRSVHSLAVPLPDTTFNLPGLDQIDRPNGLTKRTAGGIYLCTDPNWGGQCGYKVQPLNTCIGLDSPWFHSISSFDADRGTDCTWYSDYNCQSTIATDVGHPGVADLTGGCCNDNIGSFQCSGSNASGSSGSSGGAGDTYTLHSGDGNTGAGWPSRIDWINFEDMWANNLGIISKSCSNIFGQSDDTEDESNSVKAAIQSVSASSGVDDRFILAIVMQESKGCVRAPTSNYGVRNPGLMQDHNGDGTCNDAGTVQDPCPDSAITQMITEGTTGTSSGDGLQQCLTQSGRTDDSMYYAAARI